MSRAFIVVDLGFGDAGKGLVTDWLVRTRGARTVVRFNGGAQAGHNVLLPDGRHHTFSQFGAGTFVPGVSTLLSRHVVFHPTAALAEAEHLASVGVTDALARLSVSQDALVTTPFHQALGRLRELSRGAERHGTCGVGVGETVRDALSAAPIRASDLRSPESVRTALRAMQARAIAQATRLPVDRALPSVATEFRALEDGSIASRWEALATTVARSVAIVDEDDVGRILAAPGCVVFEGAQGVLLDAWHGFHPHTSWSTCTFDNALDLLTSHRFEGAITRLGVLRTYSIRHGAGPFPAEASELAAILPEVHNDARGWQGDVRLGWFDAVLARYALEVTGGVDGLVLTHADALSKRSTWPICTGYRSTKDPGNLATDRRNGVHRALATARAPDLCRQEKLGAWLRTAMPHLLQTSAPLDVIAEELPHAPTFAIAHGPTFRDVVPKT